MMESITKYELVTTLEFQLVTESSLPDWIVRLDLYKTKKNKEVLYYPRIFSLIGCGQKNRLEIYAGMLIFGRRMKIMQYKFWRATSIIGSITGKSHLM